MRKRLATVSDLYYQILVLLACLLWNAITVRQLNRPKRTI